MTRFGFLIAGWTGFLLLPGAALAQSGLQLDVSAGASGARNPFLQPGADTTSAAAFIQLDPTFRASDDVSTVAVGATFRLDQYTRRYDESTSARVGLDVTRRLTPSTRLRGRAGGSTSITSALDFLIVPEAQAPVTPPPIVLPDVSFAGSRTRTTTFDAGVGIDHEINEREQISADIATSVARFSGAGQADYRFATTTIDYRRQISERTWGFVSVRAGISDYLGRSADDGRIITPTAGILTELGPRFSLEAGGGVSLTRVKRAGGGHFSRTVPSVRIKLCERGASGATCASVSRDNRPTGLNGLSNVTNFGMSHSRRVNSKDELGASASYSLTGRASGAGFAPSGTDVFSASASYSRAFSQQIAGYVTSSYTRLYDAGAPRRSNPAVRIGVRYRFGGIR